MMVAGGVQSVEEAGFYSSEPSYYPQFYSSLLPPQHPGSHSTASYSSASTYSSSGHSSGEGWREDGCTCPTIGAPLRVPPRHPRCTCPSPEIQKKSTATKKLRHPRCTCPPSSRAESLWENSPTPPPSPPSSPRVSRCTCPKPVNRHPRCTCPDPPSPSPHHQKCTCPNDQVHKVRGGRGGKGGRLVHAVLMKYPGSTAITTDHGDFMKLTSSNSTLTDSNISLNSKSKSKSRRKVKEISPDDEIIVIESSDISPDSKSESKSLFSKLGNGHAGGSKHSDNEISNSLNDPTSAQSSPARRVKDKLCHLKQKMVASLSRPASSCSHLNDSLEDKENQCEKFSSANESDSADEREFRVKKGSLKKNSIGVVEKILPKSSISNRIPPPPPPPLSKPPGPLDDNIRTSKLFSLDDLPKPIIEDLTSPLGSVPPLSPQSDGNSPTITNVSDCIPDTHIRENLFCHPLTKTILGLGSDATLYSPGGTSPIDDSEILAEQLIRQLYSSGNFNRLQALLGIHTRKQNGKLLSSSDLAYPDSSDYPQDNENIFPNNLFRTRSLDINGKDSTDCFTFSDKESNSGFTTYDSNNYLDRTSSLKHFKPAKGVHEHNDRKRHNTMFYKNKREFSHSMNGCNSSSLPLRGKQSNLNSKSSPQKLKNNPKSKVSATYSTMSSYDVQCESGMFCESGDYIMLSKKLLDQWQLSYDACLPPDQMIGIVNGTQSNCSEEEKEQLQTQSYSESCVDLDKTNGCEKFDDKDGVRVGDQYIYFSDLVIPRNALSEQTSPRKNILSTFTKAPSSSFSNTTTFTHPPSSQTNVSQICSSPSSTLLHLATRHVGGLTSGGWEGDGCVTVHSTPKSSYGDKGLHVKPG